MHKLALIFLIVAALVMPIGLPVTTDTHFFTFIETAEAAKAKTVSVKSYKKKSGTVVRAHERSAPTKK